MALRSSDNVLIASKRKRTTGEEKQYEFTLDAIRRVADEIQYWRGYAGSLVAFLNWRTLSKNELPEGFEMIGPTGLPGKPSLPDKLISSLHDKAKSC